jgi:hypothetical protein
LFSPGPYVLQGWIGMTMKLGIVFAFDSAWVRFIDRWARLGKPAVAQPLPSNDVVMRCALAGRDEAGEIGAEARALAERSRDAGLKAAAYLLDMAAFELNTARRGGASRRARTDSLELVADLGAAPHKHGGERKARRARERFG